MLIFIGSLALLLIAARVFTSAAERIGLALGMSPFAVGVVIVGVGTSLPELVSGLISVHQGASEIVSGNVLGANVANLLLILGVSTLFSVVRPVFLGEGYIAIDLHFLVGSAFMLGVVMSDGHVGALEGMFLLLAYAVYLVYLLREGPGGDAAASATAKIAARDLGLIAAAGLGIYFSADWTVTSLQGLAQTLGISNAIIAVTVLALGTTLPELAVSISAARAGKASLAVGNILGSCIFNGLVVTGATSLLGSIAVPVELTTFTLPFFVAVALFFYLLVQDRRISNWEGALFVVVYGLFIAKTGGLG